MLRHETFKPLASDVFLFFFFSGSLSTCDTRASTQVHSKVIIKFLLGAEPWLANRTYERPFTWMNNHVICQVWLPAEAPWADGTLEEFLSHVTVSYHVPRHIWLPAKAAGADTALEGLLSSMRAHVCYEVRVAGEGPGAQITGKRSTVLIWPVALFALGLGLDDGITFWCHIRHGVSTASAGILLNGWFRDIFFYLNASVWSCYSRWLKREWHWKNSHRNLSNVSSHLSQLLFSRR